MFSRLVKIKLAEKELSVSDLSKLLGCSYNNVTQNLRNDNWRLSSMIQIANVLGCDLEIKLTDRQ